MSRNWKIYGYAVLLYALIFAGVILSFALVRQKEESTRDVLMNRVTEEFADRYTGDNADVLTGEIFEAKYDSYVQEYGRENVPERIEFIRGESRYQGVARLTQKQDDGCTELWIVESDSEEKGFLVFYYKDYGADRYERAVFLGLLAGFIATLILVTYVSRKILKPFREFTEYPERLGRGEITADLPETRNRYFGKFVWGINMLGDKISGDKKRINSLVSERQTMMTTIAHGIKTPVANIRLYAEAIETGLYREDGTPDEKDAEVARRIAKNADDITNLVKELIESGATSSVDFEPKTEAFYLKEIRDYIFEEYEGRLNVLRIPFVVTLKYNAMISSDRSGIIRVISQLLENAIKYGDGSNIEVSIEKQEEEYYFSVKNGGCSLQENELPFLFNSFWRGSNSENVEGSGIGLFEARTIAKRLGGDLLVHADREKNETEFVMILY